KMFTTDLSPYEIKGQIDGHRCLEFCVQQRLCVATGMVYDTVDSSMFCYFFKRSDLMDANLTEYENVDLFVKVMDESEIPGHHSVPQNNKTGSVTECSDGKPLDSEAKDDEEDIKEFSGYKSASKSRSDSDGGAAERRYSANDYPLSPHGYNYYGGPQDEEDIDDNESDTQPKKSYRKQGLRTVRSAEYKRQRLQESDDTEQEVKPTGNAVPFIETVKQNARKESILAHIPSIAAELLKRVKQAKESADLSDRDVVAGRGGNGGQRRPKPKAPVADPDCENEFDVTIGCKSGDKDVSKMCTNVPKIIYSDGKAMSACNETLVGGECPMVCRAGYEPTVRRLKCQQSGDRNVWQNAKLIKCKPIESECEPITTGSLDNKTLIRIKAQTQYPSQRVHYVSAYNTTRKLPLFSAYVHMSANNANTTDTSTTNGTDTEYVKNSCHQLGDNQWSDIDYNNSDYNLRPLLPVKAFRYSPEAQSLVNIMSNVAPQDPFTSRGPWMTIENRTLEMLQNRPADANP
ncbi:unnamed protein product, partial [Oppiella nova]